LSANEGALGPSPRAVAAYRDAADQIWRYPDGGATALREAIGQRFGLDPARIVCGCGSGDVLLLLAQAYTGPDSEIIYSAHGFLMYPMAARAAGATPIAAAEVNDTTSVEAILGSVTRRTRAVFIANPNNPTGTYLPLGALTALRQRLRDDVLLIVDSAYAEYSRAADYSPAAELVDAGDNTVMTRTFSKFFGLAGLRLGWAYCPPAIADVLNRIRGPFNVALPTQAAAIAVLADEAFAQASKAHNDRWLPWFEVQLRTLGLAVTPSNANFVLVRFPRDLKRNADAANAFLNARGIIPRKVGAYGLPDCLRITIGTEVELRATVDALVAFMAME
jgi:histidinol-phosphate aminotransferase